jgi:hypothetical protein
VITAGKVRARRAVAPESANIHCCQPDENSAKITLKTGRKKRKPLAGKIGGRSFFGQKRPKPAEIFLHVFFTQNSELFI